MTTTSDDARYFNRDFFLDRDVEIRVLTKRMVTTRKRQTCALGQLTRRHKYIKPGTRALYERAVVDGEIGACWCCVPCMDAQIAETDGEYADGAA